ncbi:MAG TPA: rod-binding protein [Defluviitaleaceae bacterium]|jgi:flagellar protein FlgJ|nr:flagellar biosynthesis protein FlgJ [Candidatus Epulonipiscium sp.]HOA80802.1 rod-binding protein [Defluviitaleaceae bacterium]
MKTSPININTSFPLDNAVEIQKQNQKAENFEEVLKKASEKKDDGELRKACKEFEAYFINQLFKEMRRTIQPGGLIEKSRGEEIFEEMLDEEYSKLASNGNGIGLADMLYKQLSKDIK